MAVTNLTDFLEHEHVKYFAVAHDPAFTAQEIGCLAPVCGKEMAKTVVVHLGDRFAMAVLPANQKVALSELGEAAGDEKVSFATEDEFKDLFPDCEVGAMPPFGNLYGMDVFLATPLTEDEEIA